VTVAALDLSLPRLAIARLGGDAAGDVVAAPDAFRAELDGASADRAAVLTGWLDQLDAIATREPTLRLGDSTPPRIPAVTAHLVADDFAPDLAPEIGAVQRATAVLAIVHIVETVNWPRATAGDALDPLESLVAATRAALRSWRPFRPARADALALTRGRLLAPPNDGRVMWQDEYAFRWAAQ